MSIPTVAIVGRPNVGKSSLFNRILQKRLAVVAEQPGVTRDRNYAVAEWAGRQFRLVDTGGIVDARPDAMESQIVNHANIAIEESDVVLFVVDAQVGVDPTDLAIARSLNRSGKSCLLTANKSDNEEFERDRFEFLKLGMGEPMAVSVTAGRGMGELLDALVALLPEPEAEPTEEADVIRVALVGRPNVGKSSFINKLIGRERHIVSPVAGTTRDSVDTPFEHDGQKYILVDTAGLRKKFRVYEDIEFYTTLRASKAIDNCNVAIVLIDAKDGVTAQDQKVLEQVVTARRPAVLAVNKWDLIEKDSNTADGFTREITDVLARVAFLPVIYISALTGQRVPKVLTLVRQVYEENRKRISTPDLNEFLERTIERKHPPARRGKYIKIRYLTQSEIEPPTFVFFVNHPELIDKSYIGYLTNQLRQTYGFAGVPIRLKFRR
ncbi:MAG TPA: ribosome biogenesis GTPase Der [candidate division Zixibacteria bacterium]|nr:ribosome biogenesis GTPase Der [candidate division Zixibacteria bacterium]